MCAWCGLRHAGFNKYLTISYDLITLRLRQSCAAVSSMASDDREERSRVVGPAQGAGVRAVALRVDWSIEVVLLSRTFERNRNFELMI